MPEWLDARAIGLLVFIAILTVFFGRLRHEPTLAIVLSTSGGVLAWAGLMWAGYVGQEAIGALLLASVGLFLLVQGVDRAKAAKVARVQEERRSTGHTA